MQTEIHLECEGEAALVFKPMLEHPSFGTKRPLSPFWHLFNARPDLRILGVKFDPTPSSIWLFETFDDTWGARDLDGTPQASILRPTEGARHVFLSNDGKTRATLIQPG